jgi:hypothetical protein
MELNPEVKQGLSDAIDALAALKVALNQGMDFQLIKDDPERFNYLNKIIDNGRTTIRQLMVNSAISFNKKC